MATAIPKGATKTPGSNSGVKNTRVHKTTSERFAQRAAKRLVAENITNKRSRQRRDDNTTTDEAFREETLQNTRNILRGVSKKASTSMVRRRISVFASGMSLGIAIYISIWMFFFGLFSMLSFAAETQTSVLIDSATGEIVKWATGSEILSQVAGTVVSNVVTLFGLIDLSTLFPGETLGLTFWGLSSVFAMFGYLGFFLWYKILGVSAYETVGGALLVMFVIIFDFLPFINILPWMVLFVFYMNLRSYFKG